MVENFVRVLPKNGTEALVNGEGRNRKGPRSRVANVVLGSKALKRGIRVFRRK